MLYYTFVCYSNYRYSILLCYNVYQYKMVYNNQIHTLCINELLTMESSSKATAYASHVLLVGTFKLKIKTIKWTRDC